MRKGVVVCGANGERGYFLEKVFDIFPRDYVDYIIQYSACSVSPLLVEMSGIDPNEGMICVNGCKNRCCDRLLKANGINVADSLVIDDSVERQLRPCQFTEDFDFEEPSGEEIKKFLEAITRSIDKIIKSK